MLPVIRGWHQARAQGSAKGKNRDYSNQKLKMKLSTYAERQSPLAGWPLGALEAEIRECNASIQSLEESGGACSPLSGYDYICNRLTKIKSEIERRKNQ